MSDPPGDDWAPGARLRARGALRALEPGGPAFAVEANELHRLSAQTPIARLGELAATLRMGLRGVAARVPQAALVPGFAVGDTALVDDALNEVMSEASLTHLTAVSGANCALITGAIVRALGLVGLGRRSRSLGAGAGLAGFVVLVGPDPSVQRAAVMAAVLLVSGFGGTRAVALPALGAAVALLLAVDPWQSLQPGFALSVAATGGILLLSPGIDRWLRRALRLPGWLALPLAVALAAQFACGPLLLLLQPGIPAAGVLANVVAGPAAPVGTALGLIALVAIPLGAPFGLPLGELCVWLASLPAQWVAETARLASALPLARWDWPAGPGGAALLAACQCAVVLGWALSRGRISLLGRARALPAVPWAPAGDRGRRRFRRPRAIRVASTALCALALGGFAGISFGPWLALRLGVPGDWAIVACDVGQGDALLIRDPADPGRVMLVDTGDEPRRLRDCLDLFGVRRIALLVLTHDDADHVGALASVAGRVDAALIAPTVVLERTEEREVVRLLGDAGVPVRIGAAGMRGGEAPGLVWDVLAPDPRARAYDSNAASLVLMVDAGAAARILLTADTGLEEQGALLASGANLRADVLKVAHHGSRDQDPRLPLAVGADWAIISVGAENRYGHPTGEALASLAAAGSTVLRTDRAGTIALAPAAGGGLRPWNAGVPVG
ncbi:MAG: ComEC/Rec2 family competence protein [Leucobacter sp.]|nr:ComEC/Rec2 family competence protein [Leucobacter sp.]